MALKLLSLVIVASSGYSVHQAVPDTVPPHGGRKLSIAAPLDPPLPPLVENEMEEAEMGGEAKQQPQPQLRGGRQVVLASSEGSVVCPSFLQPNIQQEQLMRFVRSAGVPADEFVNETQSICSQLGFSPMKRLSYGGTWQAMGMATSADVQVMQHLSDWVKEQQQLNKAENKTWGSFSKPNNGASAGSLALHVANHPTKISVDGPPRLMDFGCGSGQDLAAIQMAFGAKKDDSFCLDVYKVQHPNLTSFALNPASAETYSHSLNSVLKHTKNSIHVAVSMVTFHHITGSMRSDALAFISKSLAPGGIFLMAEWDNSPTAAVPSREVYYDIAHFLPSILFSHNVPTDASIFKLGTEYLPLVTWKKLARVAGLTYEAQRSKLVKVNGIQLSPEELATSPYAMNRDAYLVFHRERLHRFSA